MCSWRSPRGRWFFIVVIFRIRVVVIMAMKEGGYVVVVVRGEAGCLDGQATARHLPFILAISWGIVTAGAAI